MRHVSSSATLRSGVEMVESQSTQEGGAAEEHNEIIEGKAPGREPAHGVGPGGVLPPHGLAASQTLEKTVSPISGEDVLKETPRHFL